MLLRKVLQGKLEARKRLGKRWLGESFFPKCHSRDQGWKSEDSKPKS